MSELYEFPVKLIHRTDHAVLVDHGAGKCWLPLSQIELDDDVEPDEVTTVEVPQWLAEEKGLC